jgi:hypothetical protein
MDDFVGAAHQPSADDIKQILNCVRILTRILPLIFEQEVEDLEKEIFWSSSALGNRLAQIVPKLLFYRGFTVPLTNSNTPNVQFIIWNKGIGATSSPPATKEEILHRMEVLRLLLTLLSKAMYIPAGSNHKNPWAIELTVKCEKKAVLGMLCSFLNTIATYDPVGWATLPYNHLLFGDISEPLVSLCSQCLACLLEFRPDQGGSQKRLSIIRLNDSSESIDSLSNASPPTSSSDAPLLNLFTFYFSKLHKPDDLEFLVTGLTRLLQNPIDASKAYLPGSTKKVTLTNEMLSLTWCFIDLNKRFYSYLCQSPKVLIVLQTIINESLDARQDSTKLGTLRLSCFLLQVLSQDRNFGVQLNTLVDVSALGIHAKQFNMFSYGCWGDVVYLFIFILMSANPITKPSVLHLQESYLATMANLAPLITKFCAATANKLFTLFTVFTSPRFLLSKDKNHTKLFYFLYTIDTILQYQYVGNAQVVYTFVRNKDKVLALRDMTLESAIEAVQKLASKETSENAEVSEATTPVSTSSPNMSEKMRGKQPMQAIAYTSPSGFVPTQEWVH